MKKERPLDNETKQLLMNVRKVFTAFLNQEKQRKTPERYAILEEIYTYKKHFDAETLHKQMLDRNYQISLATIYNTLDLLHQCQLVKKHQFGKQATFEQSFGYRQHDHLICLNCDKVLEFCDPRIEQINKTMGDILGFQVSHHSLNIFAQPILNENKACKQCQKTIETINE